MSAPRRLLAALTVPLVALGLVVAVPGAAGAAPASSGAPVAVSSGAPTAVAAGPVQAAAGDEISFTGHGWGHGRGMGQYGALGYAVDHGWAYTQILDHYYGGTTMGAIANPTVSVELQKLTGTELKAIGRGLVVNGHVFPDAGPTGTSVRVRPTAGGFAAEVGSTCADGQAWTSIGSATTITISTTSQATYDSLVRVCEAAGERGYRGSLTVQPHASSGVQTTFNWLTLEDYLLGVVPRESPDGWGSAGGGRGMQALKAQAVAARSYAWASGARPSGARMCDTTSCQVYSGATWQPWGPTRTILDGTNANRAIAETAGQVRVRNGQVMRTEFSSSTGGWTTGGVFPAVQDLGDATASNPNHLWSATFTTAEVAQKLGMSSVRDIAVTGRNGLGDWGGRVTQVVVTDGAGARRTFTGEQFRSALGTDRFKSDWFTVSWLSRGVAESVVKALYQDLLGRGPDPTGLAGWSNALLAGTSQAVLVETLTRSDEYISLRVAKAYTEVLGRGPDPVGANAWLVAIRNGQATVDDVQRRFYDSTEYFVASGGTNEGYVQRLYTTMLRRPAGAPEVASWVGVMNRSGRAAVVDSIWFSLEAAKVRAGDYYATFLGRGPDPTGLDAWARVLLSNGEGAVRNGIAGSMEYRNRAVARFP